MISDDFLIKKISVAFKLRRSLRFFPDLSLHTGPDLRSFAAFKYLISGKAWPSDIGGL